VQERPRYQGKVADGMLGVVTRGTVTGGTVTRGTVTGTVTGVVIGMEVLTGGTVTCGTVTAGRLGRPLPPAVIEFKCSTWLATHPRGITSQDDKGTSGPVPV
jgi:hypothetical protein